MISIMGKTLSLEGEHIGQYWTKFVNDLKNCDCIFDWMNNFLNPIRYHNDFMNDLPNIAKCLNVETQTVYPFFIKKETEVIFNKF